MKREIVIVLGCGESGSAIACGLHRDGFDVVIIDRLDPPCPYRGMTFTDAWFLGTAELDARTACFCASLRSIPTIVQRQMIAATTWSWRGVAAALGADALVDTRAADARVALRTCFPSDADPGLSRGLENADLVTRLSTNVPRRTVVVSDPVPWRDAPRQESDIVFAQRAGRIATQMRIGDWVAAGQHVAQIGADAVNAPVAGVIRGLPARGARLCPGEVTLEIDALGDPASCFGIKGSARAFAEKVLCELRDARASVGAPDDGAQCRTDTATAEV